MSVTINASTSSGLVQTADTSGIIELQSNGTTIATVNSTGLTASSTAKAWVNYNASSGTASIRASYNVTSVTVTATGYHTITLTNALTDANYSVVGSFSASYGSANAGGMSLFTTNSGPTEIAPTTTVFGVYMVTSGNVAYNPKYVCLTVNR